jgi:brefeldin A-resistance guanine nucleotide exchange factor 1
MMTLLLCSSAQVLDSFTSTFDFSGLSFDVGLRTFLESFKLPGEAQKIDRIINTFGKAYFKNAPDIFANEDAAYILAYSVIMLNTDRHNSQVGAHVIAAQHCVIHTSLARLGSSMHQMSLQTQMPHTSEVINIHAQHRQAQQPGGFESGQRCVLVCRELWPRTTVACYSKQAQRTCLSCRANATCLDHASAVMM